MTMKVNKFFFFRHVWGPWVFPMGFLSLAAAGAVVSRLLKVKVLIHFQELPFSVALDLYICYPHHGNVLHTHTVVFFFFFFF